MRHTCYVAPCSCISLHPLDAITAKRHCISIQQTKPSTQYCLYTFILSSLIVRLPSLWRRTSRRIEPTLLRRCIIIPTLWRTLLGHLRRLALLRSNIRSISEILSETADRACELRNKSVGKIVGGFVLDLHLYACLPKVSAAASRM
jgi:hypothetical protein